MKIALIILVLVIVAILGFAAVQSNDFRVSRTAVINAPIDVVFNHVNNIRAFNAWNPWAKIDPNAAMVITGGDEGVGAKLSWAGNNQVGKGSMTNIESIPNTRVKFDMEFIEPMAGHSTAEFTFKNVAGGTEITWSMYGPKPYLQKLIGLFINCDKMIGDMFEKGLMNLKAAAEEK